MGAGPGEKGSEWKKVAGGVPVVWGDEMADNRWALVDEVSISPPVRRDSDLTLEWGGGAVEGHGEELVQLVRFCDPLEGRREASGTVHVGTDLMGWVDGLGWAGWCMVLHSYRQDPELLQNIKTTSRGKPW